MITEDPIEKAQPENFIEKGDKGFSNGAATTVTSLADLDLDEIKADANIDDYFDLLEMMQEEIIVCCKNFGQVSKFQSFNLLTMDSDQVSQAELVDLLEEMQLDLKVLQKNNLVNSTHSESKTEPNISNEEIKSLDDNEKAQIEDIDLSKETSKMAEYLEKQKASPTGTLSSRGTTIGVNGPKNDNAKQKPVFMEEKDRLIQLKLPKASEWIDAFVDGKLKSLVDQSHINSTHRIMKVKVISCHNLRKRDTSPSITPCYFDITGYG